MADATPEAALDAFLSRIRSTLGCITTATAYASPFIPGRPRSVAIHAAGQHEPGRIRVLTHGGQGELIFRLAHAFTVKQIDERGLFEVSSLSYQYRILDYEENEIVIFDWHPFGASQVTSPHIHVSAAGSIVLRQRPGSRLATQKTHLSGFHLPTSQILIEDVIELLIREFSVDPLRYDWEAVLRDNRDAIVRGQSS